MLPFRFPPSPTFSDSSTQDSAAVTVLKFLVWVILMDELVDKIMTAAAEAQPIIYSGSESELRKRVSTYIELLWSAGKRDPEELTNLGLEYLRKFLDGPNPKYSGC
jgi:hypothetical protein